MNHITIAAKEIQRGDVVSLNVGYGGSTGPDANCRVLRVDEADTLFSGKAVSVKVQILGSEESFFTDYSPDEAVKIQRPASKPKRPRNRRLGHK